MADPDDPYFDLKDPMRRVDDESRARTPVANAPRGGQTVTDRATQERMKRTADIISNGLPSNTPSKNDPMPLGVIPKRRGMKKGGAVKCHSAGGKVSSSRGDGRAARGKTKGRMI